LAKLAELAPGLSFGFFQSLRLLRIRISDAGVGDTLDAVKLALQDGPALFWQRLYGFPEFFE
jgi:hypothetical protein